MRCLAWVIGLIFTAPLAFGAEFYVDGVQGSDVNGDGSQMAPWRTISFALDSIPAAGVFEENILNVEPGNYSASSGEVFPLDISGLTQFRSDDQFGTVIDGEGASGSLLKFSPQPSQPGVLPQLIVAGFSLQNGGIGLEVVPSSKRTVLSLSELDIEQNQIGLDVQPQVGNQGFEVQLRSSNIEANQVGVRALLNNNESDILLSDSLDILDCTISGNVSHGLQVDVQAGFSPALVLRSSKLERNGGDGYSLTNSALLSGLILQVQQVSLSGNQGAGFRFVNTPGVNFPIAFFFENSTVVGNQQGGIHLQDAPQVSMRSSILWGNAGQPDAVSMPPGAPQLAVTFSNVGSGMIQGNGTNQSQDPEFWNLESLDLHLRSSSPCIGAASSASAEDQGFEPFDPAFCGQPETYCTAKQSSAGCVSEIQFSGAASLSLAESVPGMRITATQVDSNKNGLFFYGIFGQANLPFLGGTLCVQPPLQRTAIQFSGGNPPPADCSGAFDFDFQDWLISGSDPNLAAGAGVNGQFWYRDPAGSSGAGLSDAVEFEVCP